MASLQWDIQLPGTQLSWKMADQFLGSVFSLPSEAAIRLAALSGTAAAALALLWMKRARQKDNEVSRKPLPPGVPALPIVGSIPFLGLKGKDDHLYYTQLAEKYGNIYSLWIADRLVVVLNGYDVIRKALVDDAITMAGRPFADMHFIRHVNPKVLGIIDPTYTPEWKENRNLCLAILRDFGFGRNMMEQRIQNEAESLVAHIRALGGRPCNLKSTLATVVANVISSVLLGKRYPLDDCQELQEVLSSVDRMLELAPHMALVDFFPVLAYLPFFKATAQGIIECQTTIADFLKAAIARHEAQHSSGKEDDFIDAFIGRTGDQYRADQLQYVLRDLFVAGTETSATTLLWSLVYMANYPDVQKRVQQEIDELVGDSCPVGLEHKTRLPYTEAVIKEIQRCASLLPSGLPHMPLQDTELGGYRIPKDAMVHINLWSIHRDPELWPEPHVFRPERFLDDQGHVFHRSQLVPYSLGRRSCLGEVMARQELFLFFTALVQNFNIKLPPGVDKLDEKGLTTVTRAPLPFEIIAEPRI